MRGGEPLIRTMGMVVARSVMGRRPRGSYIALQLLSLKVGTQVSNYSLQLVIHMQALLTSGS